jgi:hypothetical protein
VLSVRPKIAELVFHLYGRPLHPELFQIYATRVVNRGEYDAEIHITSGGHFITWRYEGMTLAEVACSAAHPLPQKRRLMQYRLKGQRNDELQCRGGVRYRMGFQLESVGPEVFWNYHQELNADGIRDGMFHRFDSSGRMAMGALSYLNIESRNRSLRIQAFHTFPDDYAIVKSQSIFELA